MFLYRTEMKELYFYQDELLGTVSDNERYLSARIDWSNRLIGIKGATGSGKTTLLLQYIKFHLPKNKAALYTTLDDLYFLEHTLVDLAREFRQNGGTHLFLDEVHKYPRWSRELKLIYDQHPQLQIVFTSSSILEIYRGESDLSRRAVSYHLKELSLREFIKFDSGLNLPSASLEAILKDHKNLAKRIKGKLETPIKFFKEYLENGAYPYYFENKTAYLQKLTQTVGLIIENDMNAVENIVYADSLKIKKLLVAIAQSFPFTPNVSKLSERLGMNRKFLLNAIKLLDRADLVMELYTPTKGVGAFTKPEKLYLNNTNLMFALGKSNTETGTLRETFFANQMKGLHEIHLAEKGDFLIDRKYVFEIGGKGKSAKQIDTVKNGYVVRDDIEIGAMNIIPLWLFGFMY